MEKTDSDLSEEDKKGLKFEIADVLTYAFYMCEKLNVSPNQIVEEKLVQNEQRHWKFEKKYALVMAKIKDPIVCQVQYSRNMA